MGVLTWVTAANAVVIISTPKLVVVTDPHGFSVGGNDLQQVTRNDNWELDNPTGRGEVWVSNADTGQGGADFQPRAFTNDENAN